MVGGSNSGQALNVRNVVWEVCESCRSPCQVVAQLIVCAVVKTEVPFSGDDLAVVITCQSRVGPGWCSLAGVCDVFNAIFVTGNMLGETMYYGKGAGKLATASAVVADVIDAARKGSSTMYPGWDEVPVKARANAYDKHRYLVRCDESNADKAKALFEGAEEIGVCDGKFGLITRPMDSPEMEDKFDGDNGIMENWIEIYE